MTQNTPRFGPFISHIKNSPLNTNDSEPYQLRAGFADFGQGIFLFQTKLVRLMWLM